MFAAFPDLLTFFGLGLRTKIAVLILFRPGWSVISPAMCRGIVQARELADSPPDASADEPEEAAPENYSAADWGPVVSALVCAESRPNAEPDCRSDQNVTGAAVMHPMCLTASPAISVLRWKRSARPSAAELNQRFAIASIGRDGGGRCVLAPPCCD
jgi:hypothetical protein